MWWKLLLVPVGLYLAVAATLFFLQGSLLFPGAAVGGAGALPPGSERLAFETPDGVRLHGVRIRARQPGADGRPLILGFGGNAWNGEDVALTSPTCSRTMTSPPSSIAAIRPAAAAPAAPTYWPTRR
jgi:hypothetical protein